MTFMPPELDNNYCHIAPEWEARTNQKLWFVSAPYEGTVLRFTGEPTSLLYAIAPSVNEIKKGAINGLTMNDVALINPTVASDRLYAEMKMRIERQNLRAICISALTAGSSEARRIATLAKSINPNIITIFGGPHEDDMVLKTALDPYFDGTVDFSVAGDGEYALLQLTRILFDHPGASAATVKDLVLAHEEAFKSCEGRGGVFFQHGGKSRGIKLKGTMPILDSLPLMPRELLHESDTRSFSIFKDRGRNVKTAQIMTHRGCAWRCTFCSESASRAFRSVASVINEIEEIKNFSERHPKIDRDNYGAVFFDDSTFHDRSQRRREFLQELYAYLKHNNVEWGCQTRLDQIDETTLEQMKDAGCTYVFTGLESASEEMLRTMIKDEGRKHIEKAFAAINRVGMRVGVSLIFGVAEQGSHETREGEQTILETLDFMEKQVRHGNVVLVSPNIATYYPNTTMTGASQSRIDFRNPIVNRGYPWNRFEEGEGHHPKGVTSEMATFIIEESIRRFGEYLVGQDIYAVEDIKDAYRAGILDHDRVYADLNHASITRPISHARGAADAIAGLGDISSEDRRRQIEEARHIAGLLMGVPVDRTENIVLTRNTTEAASLAFWLAGLHLKRKGATVLTTNAENVSIPRAFRFHMDHGNPSGRDCWSAYQDFGVQQSRDYQITKRPTEVRVQEIDVLSNTANMEDEILRRVGPDTSLVVFCHVIRDDGRVCDVKRVCSAIHEINPQTFILVDGAQALGALPEIDVEDLGCDFYVASPHKTLGSFPLGLLYMSDRAKANVKHLPVHRSDGLVRCAILAGMFSDNLCIKPTTEAKLSLPEIVGFAAGVKSLQQDGSIADNVYGRLDHNRRKLKELFCDGLQEMSNVQITSPVDEEHSNFILTFRFPHRDNRMIVESLWRNHLVFVSYIARSDSIRASFGPITGTKEVEFALNALHDEVSADGFSPDPWMIEQRVLLTSSSKIRFLHT